MARTFHIAAYFDDDREKAIAREQIPDGVVQGSMIEGLASEEAIRTLVDNDVAVTLLEDEPMPETVVRSKRNDPAMQQLVTRLEAAVASVPRPGFLARLCTPGDLMATARDNLSGRSMAGLLVAKAIEVLRGAGEENVYRVRFRGAIRPEWRTALAAEKIELLSYRRGTYQTFLTPGQAAWLRESGMAAEVRTYDLLDTLSTALLAAMEKRETAEKRLFDLVLHRATDRRRVEEVIRTLIGAEAIKESSTHFIRFEARLDERVVATLASLPWVRSLLPCKPARLFVDRARAVVGLPAPPAPSRWIGSGEVVAVIDSGIDRDHPDFKDRLHAEPLSYKGAPVDDAVGHGTHIAGIIAGSGEASKTADGATPLAGIASGAKLVVVANIVVDQGKPSPLIPAEIAELFDLAFNAGARIFNVSWGRDDDQLPASYAPPAAAVDRYVWDHPEVFIAVAAGNSGRAPDGFCAFQTLATPATAKNVFTVGACASSRTEFAQTWGQKAPKLFPKKDASDERVAGDPELIAGISARGPTDYRSIKPDVVAPGTYILAPLAKSIHPGLAWKQDEGNPRYVYIGGTSMAAPVGAACAAIVRQYLREERATAAPSAALLKSILIGAARRVKGSRDATSAARIGFPDFDQGFGRIDLDGLFPAADGSTPRRALAFDDVATNGPDAFAQGAIRSYSVFVREKGSPLAVTLVWTDWPGNDVQNRLTLEVRGPGGRFFGNATHVFGKTLLPGMPLNNDPNNTVQQVRIEDARAGEYVIRIGAARILMGTQGYGLSVIGDLRNPELRRLKNP